ASFGWDVEKPAAAAMVARALGFVAALFVRPRFFDQFPLRQEGPFVALNL
ncbi:MAG: hypothetical protein JO365_17725, partial [Bradyrhizobium sp.]|nr:hypothetical protein [Bradyrhizobium sp.]